LKKTINGEYNLVYKSILTTPGKNVRRNKISGNRPLRVMKYERGGADGKGMKQNGRQETHKKKKGMC
jgi:hypothetical protein